MFKYKFSFSALLLAFVFSFSGAFGSDISKAVKAAKYSLKQGNGIGVYILLAEKDVAKLDRIKQIIAQKYQGKVPYQVFVSDGRAQQGKTVITLFIKGTMYGGKAYLLSSELLKAFKDSVPYYISVKDFDPKMR